jgi:hypothetical protein
MATLAARTDVAGWSDAAEFAYETLNAVQETA